MMEAVYSPGSQSLSLIPRTSLSSSPTPSLSGITSVVRREVLGRGGHNFGISKLPSSQKKFRKSSSGARTTKFRVVASLDLQPAMVVTAVAAISAASVVYLNNYSKRKKVMKEVPGSFAFEYTNKLSDASTQDLWSQNSEAIPLQTEVKNSMVGSQERVSLKADDQSQLQHKESSSFCVDTFKVEYLEFPSSTLNQDNANPPSLIEGNEEVILSVPVAFAESTTVPSYTSTEELSKFHSRGGPEDSESSSTFPGHQAVMSKASSVSIVDIPKSGNSPKDINHDHVGHELHTPGCNGFMKGHDREDLHLLFAQDNITTEFSKFVNGCSEGYKSPVHYKSDNARHVTGKVNGTAAVQVDHQVASPPGISSLRDDDYSDQLKSYNRLLRNGRLRECIELLEEMDKDGALDMNQVYHTKFFALCRIQKAVTEAFHFVKLIRNPTLSTFNMLMSVCASAQDAEGADEVWQLIQEAGLKADCKLYTTLISTYGKCGKVDLMFKVFHEMVNYGVEPNAHTYGALIDGCARAGQVAKAFGAYGMLRSKKVKPDRVIYNALISACSNAGAIDRAFDVLEEMRDESHPTDPDQFTIGVLIKACTKARQVHRVKEVYQMMQQYNIKGTAEVYTIAVHSCSESGDWSFACSIYEDMKRNGVDPDEMFLSALIDVAGHDRNLDAAFEVLQDVISQSLELNMGIMPFNSLMGACSNNQNWQRALELYEEIISMGLTPTVTTMNALITALCEGDQLQKAMDILSEMKKMGLCPNNVTYSILFVASERNDDLDCGLALLSDAKKDGVPLNMVMCKCLIGMCSRRFEKTAIQGEPIVSFKSGRPQIDCKWTAIALMVYREILEACMVPDFEVLSQVMGCLELPHDRSLRERLIEDLALDTETRGRKLLALVDGFGQYDLHAFSLLEEAASMGVVPYISYKNSPIVINARDLQIHVAEVYLLTVLKGLKHRLAAGAKLPSLVIILPVEATKIKSPKGEKMINVAGRVAQAVGALLRRLGLPYQEYESHGKIKINGRAIRRWFQPKPATPSSDKQTEPALGLSGLNLGKHISHQQRSIRSGSYSLREVSA